MKQRIAVLLLLVLGVSLSVGLCWLHAQQRAELMQLQNEVKLGHKQLTELNDRLAALSRQQNGASVIPGILTGNQGAASSLNAAQQLQLELQRSEVRQLKLQWLHANLQLAQDAALQAKFDSALLLLQQTQQYILQAGDAQADPLNLALLQAIKNDQQQIRQDVQRHRQTQSSINDSLSAIQQQLAQDSKIKLTSKKSALNAQDSRLKSWFSGILVIEKISPETQQLALDRSFVYKQSMMLVSLARKAVAENDQLSFNTYVQDMLDALQPMADAQSKSIRGSLIALQQQRLPTADQLSSLALLSQQKVTS